MNKDLTASDIQRQNILNNKYALSAIEQDFNLGGITYNGENIFTKQQVISILDVDIRTIERYINTHFDELSKNGYSILKGKKLSDFKLIVDVTDMNVGDISKAPSLGVFRFKTVLNLAMLLVESEKAREIRSRILDIVMQTIASNAGNRTYINQRDAEYLPSAFQEENYRRQFTDAIDRYIDISDSWKYAKYTNKVYQAIFEENAKEYKKILNLKEKDVVRDTFYSEILDLIAAFEAGFAESLENQYKDLNRKLSSSEADLLFNKFAEQAAFRPMILKARTLMASRDYSLRDAIHDKLEAYIQAMPESDYEKFLGEKSKNLEERIIDSIEVYKRLKDR